MQYFQTRFETLADIATQCGFDGLAGYLVLARHTTGRSILNNPPHQFSGAGVNSIHEKLGCSEARARAILDRLIESGFIVEAQPEVKAAAPRSARWLLPNQHPLDLDIPHAFVDAPKISSTSVTSALKRLKKMAPLAGCSQSAANCDATMLLISIYGSVKMRKYGGLPFESTVFRQWETLSIKVVEQTNCFTWTAVPELDRAYSSFINRSLPYIEDENLVNARFWQAFRNLKAVGLIYETVTVFDVANKLTVALRSNDFHAGSIENDRVGDSSLFKELERNYGTRLAFYDLEKETLKATLPFKEGQLYGIYRPRIRPSNEDVGVWAKEDVDRVNCVFSKIEAQIQNDYDDDF